MLVAELSCSPRQTACVPRDPPDGSPQSTTPSVAGLPRRARPADRPWLAGAERKPDAGRTQGPRSVSAGHSRAVAGLQRCGRSPTEPPFRPQVSRTSPALPVRLRRRVATRPAQPRRPVAFTGILRGMRCQPHPEPESLPNGGAETEHQRGVRAPDTPASSDELRKLIFPAADRSDGSTPPVGEQLLTALSVFLFRPRKTPYLGTAHDMPCRCRSTASFSGVFDLRQFLESLSQAIREAVG